MGLSKAGARITRPTRHELRSRESSSGAARTMAVLVIDCGERGDASDAIEAVCSSGFQLEIVQQISEGVVRLTAGGFDAIVLMVCPETNEGLEALRLVRAAARELPTIIVCQEHRGGAHLGRRAIRLGAEECLCYSDLSARLLERTIIHAVERNRKANAEKRLSYELETALSRRNQELEKVNRDLEAFNCTVSHDLRASLSTIIGMGNLIEEEHGRSLTDEVDRLLGRIRNAALSMERLLGALSELAHADGAMLRSRSVSLSLLAENESRSLRESYPDREVETVIQEGLWVEGDPGLLELLIGNLLRNAWKHATVGRGGARIEVGRLETGEAKTFFVRDDGPGFEPAAAQDLFKPFHRLGTDVPGLGVGLATVDRIAQRHGGRAWAESRPGEGAAFCFTLEGAGPSDDGK